MKMIRFITQITIVMALLSAALSFSCMAETLVGEAAFKPWSGYWWPIGTHKLITGYNGHPSPIEKYDLITTGSYPSSAYFWERENNYDPDAVGWAGFCHAWSNASISENIDFKPTTYNGVFFGVGDQKGLMTLCHEDDPQKIENCGVDPLRFHRYLLEYIGENKLAIGADLDASEAIWTYPIYRYEMNISRDVTDGSGGIYDEVVCTVYYANDFVDPDYEGTDILRSTYRYGLYKDNSGDYTGGKWISNSVDNHPEWVWVPLSRRAENPNLNYTLVREVAVKQDDDYENTTSLSPGHYALVVAPNDTDVFTIDLSAGSTLSFSCVLDSQNSNGIEASYTIANNSRTITTGEINNTLQSKEFDIVSSDTYTLTFSPADENTMSAFVHIYVDISYAENVYVLNVPGSTYWSGLSLSNSGNNSDQNRIFATYFSDDGIPLGSVVMDTELVKMASWTNLIETQSIPIDTYSYQRPVLMRVSSQYPVTIFQVEGSNKELFNQPALMKSNSINGDYVVVPLLTGAFNVSDRAIFTLFNPTAEDFEGNISYYTTGGSFKSEKEFTVTSKAIYNYIPGSYPGGTDASGWAVINDPTHQLLGRTELHYSYVNGDELPLLTGGQAFVVPNVASLDGFTTFLTLINLQDVATSINVTCTNGTTLNKMQNIVLEPREKREMQLNGEFFGLTDDETHSSYLDITASADIAGFFTHKYGDSSIVSYPLFKPQHKSKNKRISHVESGADFWTALILLNPSTQVSYLTITGYNVQGNVVAVKNINLNAGTKLSTLVSYLFPETNRLIKNVIIESSEAIYGYIAYGSTADSNQLCGQVME